MIEVELFDGTPLQFPEGTSQDVIDRAVKQETQERLRAEVPDAPGGVATAPGAVDDFKQKFRDFGRGAASGATFDFLDNASGVVAGVAGMTPRDPNDMTRGYNVGDYSGSFSDRYQQRRDDIMGRNAESQERNPGLYTGGKIAGATAEALTSAPLATGKSLLGTMGRGAGIGGVEGALHEAGDSNGQDTLRRAARGAAIGAGVGAAVPAAVAAGGAVKNAVKDPTTGVMDALLGRANQGKANRAIAGAVRKSGMSIDDIDDAVRAAAREGQPDFAVMDALGRPGARAANSMTRGGNDAGEEIARFLETRQLGQPERVGAFVDDAFGTRGKTALEFTDAQKAARKAAADVNYPAARQGAGPVDVRGAVAVIDDRIGGMQGSNISGDGIDGTLQKFRNRLMANNPPKGELARELSDFDRVLSVKQDLQDEIGALTRAGKNNAVRELKRLEAALDEALEQSSDGYRLANDTFRQQSRVLDAVPEGERFARPNMRPQDTVNKFSGMPQDQQQGARVGYADVLQRKIEGNPAPTANRARPLQSPKMAAEADAMALDPELYKRQLAREQAMWETQNRALQGSRTMDNMADVAENNEIASGLAGAVKSGASGNFGDAVSRTMGALAPMAKGQTDATRQIIARALMSQDPRQALAAPMRQDMRTQTMRRLMEALLRNSGRELYSR